jgi:hypothetical protein
MILGALPAVLLVLGAVLLMMVAMFMNGERRTYALESTDALRKLALAVLGLPPPDPVT